MEKQKTTKVYFCPNCKSSNVGYMFGIKNLLGIIPTMQCKKCKFRASVFPQWVMTEKQLKMANSKLNKHDASQLRRKKVKK